MPTDPAINIIKRKLDQDQELHLRTPMTVEHIIRPLEFCLKTTYFQFQGRFFEQLQGAAIGSPITPIVAKLYMEEFEIRAINTAEHPPRMWRRYVDDIFVVIKNIIQRGVPKTPQQFGPTYPVYYRSNKRRWVHSFLGHLDDATS